MSAHHSVLQLRERMQASIIGQQAVIDRLLIGLLADGNLLIEGLPGLAKTRAVKALAKNLEASFSRIQFTPDLLPADITGSEIYNPGDSAKAFTFQPGPIFGNIVLADEINRAPAKVQAALLEAMEERQVTVASTTHKMPALFMVMATQNPIEQEGTYPLPEAQMDRFLMHVVIGYGDEAAEVEVIRLVRGESASNAGAKQKAAPIDPEEIFAARREIEAVFSSPAIDRYIVDLVFATRYPQRYSDELAGWIDIGASPRGAIGLDRCARAHAWLHGRDHVRPDDVQAIAANVLRHRVKLSYLASADQVSVDDVLNKLLELVAVP
ncbi:MoxR family ATPase [Gammaproteobacteria bacterium]|nr:MoxR family ATPase [Gammaproteobacteria bacterium]